MKDPFVILRDELVEAAERAALPAQRKRWGWLRRPSRPVAVVLAALVIAGSAAAAVLSLSASQPLVGRVPGAVTPASLAGYRYRIAVTPIPFAGAPPGWQPWIVYNSPGTSGYGERGGPLPTTPIFAVGGPTSVARGETVVYVLTSPQVWAVRIGSRTIRTVSSPALPTGDRAAVFFVPAKGPGFLIPGLPAGPPPGKHPPPMKNIPTIQPLDRSGQVIATHLLAPPAGPPLYTWIAPNAVTRWWPLPFGTVPYHHRGYHGRTHPGPGVCELGQHGLQALHAQWGHTVPWISPVHDALGEEFLSCIDAAYYLHGWPLDVAVLLDGHHPGQVLGPIPGARPVPGQPEVVSLATGQFPSSLFTRNFGVTAKRVGNAWLIVQGGSGLAQRVQVLNALRISKLDLHHLKRAGSAAVPGGFALLFRAEPTARVPVNRATVARVVAILRRRIAAVPGGESTIAVTSAGTMISVHASNRTRISQQQLISLVGTTARMALYDWEANALTPTGRTVASLLLSRDATAMAISQGGGPGPPGSAGAGSMPLYRAVRLATKQPYSASKYNARFGPEYFAFGAPGSTACATATRDQHTVPVVGQHCYLAGPADNLQDLHTSLPRNVSRSEAQVLTVQRGTVVLQALPASFSHPPAWSDPTAQFYVLSDHASLFGTDVTNPRQSTQSGQPYVTFGFTSKGSSEYQNVTAQITHRGALVSGFGKQLNQHFAVALDSQLITVPLIDSKAYPNGIPGNTGAAIFGPFTIQSARDLATELGLGALPINLKLIAVVPHH
jgi:hypothetical protein